MRAAVQRVLQASVKVDEQVIGSIDKGLLVYAAVDRDDQESDLNYIAEKLLGLRIFPDQVGKMNLDIRQASGQMLVISAFTLQADARKGRRPSFDGAAPPDKAQQLYEQLCQYLAEHLSVQRGKFAAYMHVSSINDGPICILLDSKKKF